MQSQTFIHADESGMVKINKQSVSTVKGTTSAIEILKEIERVSGDNVIDDQIEEKNQESVVLSFRLRAFVNRTSYCKTFATKKLLLIFGLDFFVFLTLE